MWYDKLPQSKGPCLSPQSSNSGSPSYIHSFWKECRRPSLEIRGVSCPLLTDVGLMIFIDRGGIIFSLSFSRNFENNHPYFPTYLLEIISPLSDSSLSADGIRFSSNNFKFFLLSIQSSLHLSLAVLVCYRSPTVYLALGGVYHPLWFRLHSQAARLCDCKIPLWAH